MTSALQNRLVGTIIVVALVVILVPEFLDGEKRTNQQSFVDVPPVLQVVDIEEAKEVDLSGVEQAVNQPIELVDEQAVDDVPVTTNATNNSPNSSEEVTSNSNEADPANASANGFQVTDVNEAADEAADEATNAVTQTVAKAENKATKAGWVVQLGSFRHEKNVQALLKTLNDAGYRAYSTPVMTSAGKLNKVFVGPELDKNTLEQALPRLQEITKLKGKITAFEVSAD